MPHFAKRVALKDWVVRLAVMALCAASVFGKVSSSYHSPTAAIAEERVASDVLPPTAFPVLRVRIHDVDTVRGDVILPWGHGIIDRQIRAAGFDGWEVARNRIQVEPFKSFSASEWAAEIQKGAKGRDELKKLAEGGTFYVEWVRGAEDSVYGRIEGPFWVRTASGRVVDVRKWAERNGHVRPATK